MTKDIFITVFFFTVIGVIHFLLQGTVPAIHPKNDFYLIYAVVLIINFMGITLFFLGRSLETGSFAGLFMIFTTIQLLGAMSFSLAIKLIRPDDAKNTLLQFVIVFFLNLIFQTFYYVRKTKLGSL